VTVAASIVVHGISVTPLMRRYVKRKSRRDELTPALDERANCGTLAQDERRQAWSLTARLLRRRRHRVATGGASWSIIVCIITASCPCALHHLH